MQQEEIDPNKRCCANCKWYENRTCFCRKNPPLPIPQYVKGIGNVTNSAFPKITLPFLDWCSNFENDKQQLV